LDREQLSGFNRAKIDAGIGKRDLHFHDLRGTAATRLHTPGLFVRVIAEVIGWEEEYVEKSSPVRGPQRRNEVGQQAAQPRRQGRNRL
jgi:hypothetical protein